MFVFLQKLHFGKYARPPAHSGLETLEIEAIAPTQWFPLSGVAEKLANRRFAFFPQESSHAHYLHFGKQNRRAGICRRRDKWL
jgi:hypothetical protein